MNKMNKKAELAFKQVMFMFVRCVILIIIFVSIIYITKKHIITTTDITDTEQEIIIRSLMMNKGSVIYVDPVSGRAYPYVIDPAKLNKNFDGQLEQAFDFGEKQKWVAVKLSLFDMSGKPYGHDDLKTESVYINREYYQTWLDMARTGFIGPGAATEKTKSYYVNVFDDGVMQKGIIEISVVMPNS